jgi:hypothetical protein
VTTVDEELAPRVWARLEVPEKPEGVDHVTDSDGDHWHRYGDNDWCNDLDGVSWLTLLGFGPLTEVDGSRT